MVVMKYWADFAPAGGGSQSETELILQTTSAPGGGVCAGPMAILQQRPDRRSEDRDGKVTLPLPSNIKRDHLKWLSMRKIFLPALPNDQGLT